MHTNHPLAPEQVATHIARLYCGGAPRFITFAPSLQKALVAHDHQIPQIPAQDRRRRVKPLTFTEWILGRIAGNLEVRAATMAQKRGDYVSLNHALLSIWAGTKAKAATSQPNSHLRN
ncbi:hypothetical protein [Amycolatopsis plumensis]|uniref:hypothetical protein n=1 Tax=Amycolatopsis plumensis TaxID=236508 RepID=UPI00360A6213